MRCSECEDRMDAYLDGELPAGEVAHVSEHIASCENCTTELRRRDVLAQQLHDALPRLAAPDTLRARIRHAVESEGAHSTRRWRFAGVGRLAAAALVGVIGGSALTLAVTQRTTTPPAEVAVLESHVRSLMPGHLTDVVSTDQHNVKPWFNGRVDVAPAVPALDSAGFPLLGGRLDYVDGHVAAAVVYGRRKHVVTVYSWPARAADDAEPRAMSAQGFNLVQWRRSGVERWAVSDIPGAELRDFVRRFELASQ